MNHLYTKSALGILFFCSFLASCNSLHHSSEENKINISNLKSKNVNLPSGKYFYSNYKEDPQKGTGIGENYTITINKSGCKIDIDGYQADDHFPCEIKNIKNTNLFEIFNKKDNSKFGEIKKSPKDDLILNITYYDAYNDKVDNNFYPLERLK